MYFPFGYSYKKSCSIGVATFGTSSSFCSFWHGTNLALKIERDFYGNFEINEKILMARKVCALSSYINP